MNDIEIIEKLKKLMLDKIINISDLNLIHNTIKRLEELTQWKDIEDCPRCDNTFRKYGLYLTNLDTGKKTFENYELIEDDNGHFFDRNGDHFSCWTFEDFSHFSKFIETTPV